MSGSLRRDQKPILGVKDLGPREMNMCDTRRRLTCGVGVERRIVKKHSRPWCVGQHVRVRHRRITDTPCVRGCGTWTPAYDRHGTGENLWYRYIDEYCRGGVTPERVDESLPW